MILEIIVALVAVVGSILAYYHFYNIPPGSRLIVQPPPSTSSLDDNHAKLLFFYTPWCPWCKKAEPAFSSLKQMFKNDTYTYGGKTIFFEEINAESDKGKAALYNITAYPTFKIETATKMYEMRGKPSVTAFRTFLTSALGAEKIVHN